MHASSPARPSRMLLLLFSASLCSSAEPPAAAKARGAAAAAAVRNANAEAGRAHFLKHHNCFELPLTEVTKRRACLSAAKAAKLAHTNATSSAVPAGAQPAASKPRAKPHPPPMARPPNARPPNARLPRKSRSTSWVATTPPRGFDEAAASSRPRVIDEVVTTPRATATSTPRATATSTPRATATPTPTSKGFLCSTFGLLC